MRILLDQCVPKSFGKLLAGHDVQTAYEKGWEKLSNGKMLAAAAQEFDAFVTVDQNLRFQQNLATIPIPEPFWMRQTIAIQPLYRTHPLCWVGSQRLCLANNQYRSGWNNPSHSF